MENNKDHSGQFATVTHEDWEALAKKSLRGADPDSLSVETADGIKIAPLYARSRERVDTLGHYPYTRATSTTRNGLPPDQTTPATPEIRQRYTTHDAANTNARIVQELNLGVTGVHLDLTPQCKPTNSAPPVADFARLLDGVYLDLVKISLSPGADFVRASAELRSFWKTNATTSDAGQQPDQQPTAAFNADPLACLARDGVLPTTADVALTDMAALALQVEQHCPGSTTVAVDTTVYHNAGASDGQELALLLATGKLYLQAMVDAGLSVSAACRQIECTLAVDTDFFASVASARAARTLWAKMTRHCGADDSACELRLAMTTSSRMLSRYDVWTNQLRATVAASAALLAGADTLTVQPFDLASDQPGDVGRRMARNTTNILLEESGLHHVRDPLGGSGYIEDLTDALCANAWSRFQLLEKSGGLLQALRSNQLQKDIESARETLLDAVAHRRVALVGVSEFPDPDETSNAAGPDTESGNHADPSLRGSDDTVNDAVNNGAERVERLPPIRLATSFESLRQHTDAVATQRGVRPTITSFCFGTPAQYLPQLQFCENLLTAAGIAVGHVWPQVARDTTTSDAEPADQSSDQLSAPSADPTILAQAAQDSTKQYGHVALVCLPPQATAITLSEITKILRDNGLQFVFCAGRPDGIDSNAGVDGFLYRDCNALEVLRAAMSALDITS